MHLQASCKFRVCVKVLRLVVVPWFMMNCACLKTTRTSEDIYTHVCVEIYPWIVTYGCISSSVFWRILARQPGKHQNRVATERSARIQEDWAVVCCPTKYSYVDGVNGQ